MSEFKKGDRVRVISGGCPLTPNGSEGVVTVLDADWPIRVQFPGEKRDWGFHHHNIELVKENEVTAFQVGDKVSVVGYVTKVFGSDATVVVDFDNNGTGGEDSDYYAFSGVAHVYSSNTTLLERIEKPIPAGTIVEDSHGCKFILGKDLDGDAAWIKFEGGGQNTQYLLDSFGGKALSRLARKSL